MNSLLAFGGLADDSHSILAAIHQFAFMRIELLLDNPRRVFHGKLFSVGDFELLIAAHTYPKIWGWANAFNDLEFTFCHTLSLAPNACAN